MSVQSYLPWQCAEIAALCCRYGVPEQTASWLADGYTVHEVEANLRTRNVPVEEVMRGMLSPPVAPSAVAASAKPAPADDWAAVRQANAERLARQGQPVR
jgi:hypothetical protein